MSRKRTIQANMRLLLWRSGLASYYWKR